MMPKPNFIWVYNRLPVDGGTAQRVPIEDFMQQYERNGGTRFIYTEAFPSSPFQFVLPPKPSWIEQTVANYIENSTPVTDKLALCYMGKKMGYSTFARDDIPPYTFLGVYIGRMERNILGGHYAFDLSNVQEGWVVNSQEIGGIMRFLPHLPDRLNEIEFDIKQLQKASSDLKLQYFRIGGSAPELIAKLQQLPDEVITSGMRDNADSDQWVLNYDAESIAVSRFATSNVEAHVAFVCGMPLALFSSRSFIPRGSLVGFNYGNSYARVAKFNPVVCHYDGKILTDLELKLVPYCRSMGDVSDAEPDQFIVRFKELFPEDKVATYWQTSKDIALNMVIYFSTPASFKKCVEIIAKIVAKGIKNEMLVCPQSQKILFSAVHILTYEMQQEILRGFIDAVPATSQAVSSRLFNSEKPIPQGFSPAQIKYRDDLRVSVKSVKKDGDVLPTLEVALRRYVFNNDVKAVYALIKFGALVNDISPSNSTALDLAKNNEMKVFLKSQGAKTALELALNDPAARTVTVLTPWLV